jgi:hypothetical protein
VTLTPVQKKAGRAFRAERQAALDALNGREPPGQPVLVFWRVVRHECPEAGGASTCVTLREHRETSPAYWVCYCGVVSPLIPGSFPHSDCDGGKMVTAEGQFTFTWKEGHCSGCGLVLRSRAGISAVSDHQTRDGQASAHRGDPRLTRA